MIFFTKNIKCEQYKNEASRKNNFFVLSQSSHLRNWQKFDGLWIPLGLEKGQLWNWSNLFLSILRRDGWLGQGQSLDISSCWCFQSGGLKSCLSSDELHAENWIWVKFIKVPFCSSLWIVVAAWFQGWSDMDTCRCVTSVNTKAMSLPYDTIQITAQMRALLLLSRNADGVANISR